MTRLIIRGHDLPGLTCGDYSDVHVGIQHKREPVELIAADAESVTWTVDIEVRETDHGRDFRGPAVQGKRGERFVYLTWGELPGGPETYAMFRRAKLMLAELPEGAEAVADVHLTDDGGMPRCARLLPPALTWREGGE